MRRLNLTGWGLILTMATTVVSGCGSASTSAGAASDCRPGQLSLKYYGGGVATGNNFGAIVVLNRSSTACMWRGGVSVVPLTAHQQALEVGTRLEVMTATSKGILLSPHDHVVRTQPAPAGDSWGQIDLIGFARDDPKSPSGMCSPANKVRPPYWGVATLGEKYTMANYDRGNGEISPNYFVGLTSCHAHFGILSVGADY